jgi:predicted PurR-regulated permease PerM
MSNRKANQTFIQRVLIVAMIAVAAVSVWLLLPLLLLVFGSVLLAFTLRTLARPLRWCGLNQGAAVILTALIAAVGFILAAVLFGAEFVTQLNALNERAGITLSRLAAFLGLQAEDIVNGQSPVASIAPLIPRFLSFGWTVGQAIAGLLFVIVASVYLALDPKPYRDGLVTLVPSDYKQNVLATLDDIGEGLQNWLGGTLLSMVLVGTMTGVGLWLVGVQSPLALGLLAGFANFVPYIGSLAAAAVTVVMAAGQSFDAALAAIGVLLVIQQIESYILAPLVVGRAVSILPATGMFAMFAMALLFGPLGVIFGFPLAIVADISIRRLYVRDTLDKPVEILGKPAQRSEVAVSAETSAET